MLGTRNNQHSFAKVPEVKMARSQFDRSFTVKDTFEFDYLTPVFVDEILPGDTVNLNLSTFARLATPAVPIMDNLYIDYFAFFTPNRLVWDNWERFNGAQDDPGDSTDFTLPTIPFPAGGPEVGSIFDKFGLPTDIAAGYSVQCLPLRGYNLIWNSWFRDQNLQNSVVVSKDDGPDAVADFALLKRGKRHDYFTSCLPWPQKGDAVSLPLGTRADVKGIGVLTNVFAAGPTSVIETGSATPRSYADRKEIGDNNGNDWRVFIEESTTLADTPNIYADLTNATAATINQLREAMQVQSILELDARGGTRYVELLQAHFNVTSPDFRLQRPELLSVASSRINIHPVAQTTPTAGTDPMGGLAAFGTSSTQGALSVSKSFTEHGYLLVLACARADLTYQQGVERMWNRSTRYDFFWPKLQEIGEQPVYNKEIYCQGTADDAIVFGYQERYAEYRFKPSIIKGEFRSTFATPLDQWHMAEEFGSLPALNAAFIVQNTPIDRAIEISGSPHLLFDCWAQYKHARPMMTYSVPSTLGRF